MSTINPLGNTNPIYRPQNIKQAPKPAAAAEAYSPNNIDKLELSNVDRLMTQLKTNDVRWDKVNEIKAQIANGSYETDDKLTAAADKMLEDVL
jgi:flagellar biosynthesis anti-sigma factor FlgM